MAIYISLFRAIIFFFSRILQKHFRTPRNLHRKVTNALTHHPKLQKCPSFLGSGEPLMYDDHGDHDHTLIFNVEETLLKSSSLFPYFMLVTFEAGSPLRALLLLALYPLICFLGKEIGLKIMVMVAFFGIKKKGFMVGRAVLPKVFLEDVGLEGFEMVNKCKRKVGVSHLPQFMVESFLKDYLKVDHVVGRELKVFCGHFIGIMEDNKHDLIHIKGILKEEERMSSNVIGISSSKASLSDQLFAFCKEIYLTNEATKRKWQCLPRDSYPKPLIFHDGRLALKPTPAASLALFIWLPFGTLLAPLTAVTYSLSRMSEILAPIRTVRLSRDRNRDGIMMKKLLDQGDLVVCPEGTTCRENFLLRFSPLFGEISQEIVPVAMDTYVNMFYGTTAGGLKCLDPLFFLMNPTPSYVVRLLAPVPGASTCQDSVRSRFDVANEVQRDIGKALGFKCTGLTRKDKYMILAGNHGVV
ncbi:hypothetical protein Cgig2_020544 [Carnegiea gigantea]|uniref:Glycerol-3-phosphate acyltransferase RAM2/GPAT1-8 HAD-like domain-containing protein n=1 Tax=Carnegiea gigantea TaxID=171969 RepID=A0A9Q1JR23_9CARY|nr:hypothetical protein Cgig2_020544 [Carnegiea gigantea]